MKAEHRHQLQTNILADRMGRLVQGMRSSPRSTSVLVWVFVVLAVGVYVFWQYYASATHSMYSALWAQVDAATHKDPYGPSGGMAGLVAITQANAPLLPGRTARFLIAREELQRGQEQLTGSDRTEAGAILASARTKYADLARECADSPILAQEARMGIAKVDEALVGITTPENPTKDLEKAIASYRELAAQFPDGVQGKAAAGRAEELERDLPQVAKFYEELREAAKSRTPPPLPVPPQPEAKGP